MRRPTLLALLSSSLIACVAPVGGDDDVTPDPPVTENKSACANKPARKVTDDITIRTAADWDALPTGCWDLEAKLTLDGDTVTSLSKLEKLKAVNELEILDTKLTTLDIPLYVYEKVTITGNAQLTNLSNLTIDKHVALDIEIDDNAALTDIGDIATLAEISGDLAVTRNTKLAALDLRQLTTVGGTIRISANPALATISLGKAETLGRFEVLDNAALTTIATSPVREFTSDVTIRGNAKLTALSTMSSLEKIGGALTIDNNAALTSIGMFTSSMRYVTTLVTVSNNKVLTDLGQLSHLQAIGGATVSGNSALPYCRALEINHCVSSHGTVSITNNLANSPTTCTCWCE